MCLAVPGQILERLDDGSGEGRLHRRAAHGQRRVHAGGRARRLGARPRRLRAREDRRGRGEGDARPARRGDRRGARGMKYSRRVPRRPCGEGDRSRALHARRAGVAREADGGLRRAHARDLPARARRPAAGRGRARARARLSGLRDPDGSRRRRDLARGAAGGDARELRRHAARPGRQAPLAARGEGPRRGRADRLLAARRARARRRRARPRGRSSSASASRRPRPRSRSRSCAHGGSRFRTSPSSATTC